MFLKKKDWRERSLFFNRIRIMLRIILGVFLAFSFSWFFLETVRNVRIKSEPEAVAVQYEINQIKQDKNAAAKNVPQDEACQPPVETFLSDVEDEKINVIETGDFDSELAVRHLQPETASTINDIAEMDKIEDTYEEDLPADVYEEELEIPDAELIRQNGDDYHVYHGHRNIQEIEILPSKRPWYFGPQPVIAVVIDDMGVSPKRTADIISLNAPLTSSFLTYAKHLPKQVTAARKSGHEIMLHVPMQAKSNKDAAPDVLTVAMSPKEITERLEEMLSKFEGIMGINNHMGSLFTEDSERLGTVMQVLNKRGLFFLDSKTSAKSVGRQEAAKHGVVYAHRHVFLDNENNVDYIIKQLQLTERIAKRNGYAVAIGHPKSGTYEALKQWLPELEKKGIKLVPMSEVVAVTGIPR